MRNYFADIILPLAVPGLFTYRVPEEFCETLTPGARVIVQFGNKKLYTGIVAALHDDSPVIRNVKDIIDVIEKVPVVNEKQIALWEWISDYYMCTTGEVMKAALPAGLCPESETDLFINPEYAGVIPSGDIFFPLISKFSEKKVIPLKSLPPSIGEINTLKLVNELIAEGVLMAGENIRERYRPKEETFIELSVSYTEEQLNKILDDLSKAPRQFEVLAAYIRISRYTGGSEIVPVKKSLLVREAKAAPGVIETLVKKGILVSRSLEVTRLNNSENADEPLRLLSNAQSEAYNDIANQLKDKDIVLLSGVTSSGKTEIYIHLIQEQLKEGKQVLFMLPEIALTAQIILRLKKHFGRLTGVYHSRFSDPEKVEIWKRVAGHDPSSRYSLILGVRSSLFLPFSNLGLIIVDEEHDGSYKQQDPAPRYNARDSAIMLAGIHKAKTLLGSATPSIESYNNAQNGKYGLTFLKERYGLIKLPEIVIANTREAYRKKLMVSHFTPELLHSIDEALGNGEQVILFQNRRGFSPYIECSECGWIPLCNQCAVNLTYHKGIRKMVCHYCGFSLPVPAKCENCHSAAMVTRGFGTEKIEDEIKIVFPDARVARLDQDTTRNKNSFNRIIQAFEERRVDILIGTQMISKGLDFENLTVVGVLNADNLLNFPDFRAHERSFQMLEQVSGRAGRRQKQGRVVIQTFDPSHMIIRQVLRHDYEGMFRMQAGERKTFNYPPFCRMIKINLRHKEKSLLNMYADILGADLRTMFGKRVLGPEFPLISQVQTWYIKTIILKIEKEKSQATAKNMIREALTRLGKEKGASGLKIAVDVDPY
jgi:primosomal protein N' (replication factor Y)